MSKVVGYVMAEKNLIREMLEEELDRNRRAQTAYIAERDSLPRGSIRVKTRGVKRYCYLKFRDGKKTITDYVGVADAVEEKLRAQVEQRKALESTIQQLKSEQRYIERALKL